jgi:D-aminoacyl-tRNA deacylase
VRVVVQRVTEASVTVDDVVVGSIGRGYLILAGYRDTDTPAHVEWMAAKIDGLRLFPDDEQKMNLSLADVDGAVLVVSQFTLYGDVQRGRRPSFVAAAAPEQAIPLYEHLVACLRQKGLRVETGRFGAMMAVSLVNWGPVTLVIER